MSIPEAVSKRQRGGRREAKKIGIILFTVFIIFSSLAFMVGLSFQGEKIYPGVKVCGIDIGGMTAAEAEEAILAGINQELVIKAGNETYSYTLKDLGVIPKIDEAINQAIEAGHGINPIKVLQERAKIKKEGREISLDIEIKRESFEKALETLRKKLEIPAQNAKLYIRTDGTVVVTPEIRGRKIDEEIFALRIKEAALKNNNIREVAVPLIEDVPDLTAEKIAGWGVFEKIASYRTNFSTSIPQRKKNIRLAASKIDGILLMPGQEFSFNNAVGKRTVEGGFDEAPVYINGQLKKDIGGGICQVSSTLYNAVLLAGLEIVKRASHSMLVSYVKPGFDATVDYGNIDFVFRNNYHTPVYIQALAPENSLEINIYGKGTGKKYSLYSEVIETIPFTTKKIFVDNPSDVKVVQEGKEGVKVIAYRIVYQNGKEIGREKLGVNVYRPMEKIVNVLRPGLEGKAVRRDDSAPPQSPPPAPEPVPQMPPADLQDAQTPEI